VNGEAGPDSAGLNQAAARKEMGMSAMAISKYETGEWVPNSRVLLQLSKPFTPAELSFFRQSSDLSAPQYVPEGH